MNDDSEKLNKYAVFFKDFSSIFIYSFVNLNVCFQSFNKDHYYHYQ